MLERAQCFEVFQVPYMLAEKGFPASSKTHGVLELGPGAEDRGDRVSKKNRQRRVSSCPAHRTRVTPEHTGHRIVAPHVNLAVVKKEVVGNPVQARPGVCIVHYNWFIALVPAGHHQRTVWRVLKQEKMKGRIRKKDPRFLFFGATLSAITGAVSSGRFARTTMGLAGLVSRSSSSRFRQQYR